MKRIALVTGANRGLGFETSRQLAKKDYLVIMTSRDEKKGQVAAQKLLSEKLNVVFHKLDVTDQKSVDAIRNYIEKEYGRLDVLVNNAGVFLDNRDFENFDRSSAFASKVDTLQETFNTNTLGAFRMCQALIPIMRKNKFGRVVNVSSGMGQLSEMNGGFPAYRISKTALNAVTRIFSDECSDDNILVNSVCPGWVKTDMGGREAERTPEEGADTIVWAATLTDGSTTGAFFRDREPIAW